MTNWKKAFVMVDVSEPKNKDYCKLIDWLKENSFEFTDVDFNAEEEAPK